MIRAETDDGAELVAFMLRVFRGNVRRTSLKDRIAAATWLADRGFGKPHQAVALKVADDPAQRVNVHVALHRLSDGALRELQEAFRLETVHDDRT